MINYSLVHQSPFSECQWEITERSCLYTFNKPVQCLSSAVLNGGMRLISQCLNWQVPKTPVSPQCASPQQSLIEAYQSLDSTNQSSIPQHLRIGLMTAASMASHRCCLAQIQLPDLTTEFIIVSLSCGIDNSRAAGEPSDECLFLENAQENTQSNESYKPGTINIVVYCSFELSPAALVEAHMLIAEAKARVFQQRSIASASDTDLIATGTGTDSTVVSCKYTDTNQSEHSLKDDAVHYIGKHTLYGEALAQGVIRALEASLDK